MSRLSNFMTCRERFHIKSEESISQLWNIVGRYNLVYMLSDTHIHKLGTMLRLIYYYCFIHLLIHHEHTVATLGPKLFDS